MAELGTAKAFWDIVRLRRSLSAKKFPKCPFSATAATVAAYRPRSPESLVIGQSALGLVRQPITHMALRPTLSAPSGFTSYALRALQSGFTLSVLRSPVCPRALRRTAIKQRQPPVSDHYGPARATEHIVDSISYSPPYWAVSINA